MPGVPPAFDKQAFDCPHCLAFAHQNWGSLHSKSGSYYEHLVNYLVTICQHCEQPALWSGSSIVHPKSSMAPPPNEDMPEKVRSLYNESRDISGRSPRASAALLRLAIDVFTQELGAQMKGLDDRIGELRARGLPQTVIDSLDVVRVVGNNAVHPGEIDLEDDPEMALSLFDLLNVITDYMVTQPARIKALRDRLPEGAKTAIQRRDKGKDLRME